MIPFGICSLFITEIFGKREAARIAFAVRVG